MFVPDIDATFVARTLAAGGKVVGKHMMNGFMGDYGKPLSPHNPERITGGLSSGSGAALAAADPMAAIEANLRRNWMLMPIAYDTKPTNYTGIRLLRCHAAKWRGCRSACSWGEFPG